MKPPYENTNRPIRIILRIIGFILTPTGAIFLAIGLIDFFSAFGGHGMPTKFWCAFVGMPLLGLGIFCLKAGFLGSIGKYIAGEGTPVVLESAKYMAYELRPTIRQYAKDFQSGSRPEKEGPLVRMKHLDELKQNGLISESEYELKRREVLQDI